MMSFRAVRAMCVLTAFGIAGGVWAGPTGLTPRTPLPKIPTEKLIPLEDATGRLIVKFTDEVKARPLFGDLHSMTNADLDPAMAVAAQYGVEFMPAISKRSNVLSNLETRAANVSGKAQPDLAGMMFVVGAENTLELELVAKALNQLDSIEWVEFERPVSVPGLPQRAEASVLPNVMTSGPIVDGTNATLKLHRSTVAKLQVPTKVTAKDMNVRVPIDGIEMTLQLKGHSLFSNDFRLIEVGENGVRSELNPNDVKSTVRGIVANAPGAQVAGALLEDGLYAVIQWDDGSRHWVQPVAATVAGAEHGHHAIYTSEDVAEGGICAANEADFVLPPGFAEGILPLGGTCPGVEFDTAEIALDLDFNWVSEFDDLATSGRVAAAVINIVNLQYERDLSITHIITAIVARTSESANPYSTNNSSNLLNQFKDEWDDNFTGITRDITHLFTGRDLDGGVIGVAFLFGMCSTNRYGLSQKFGSFGCQTDLTAHELGHNWGAFHCDCAGQTPAASFTMNPFVTCANQFNPDLTVPGIDAFRDFLAGTCLDCSATAPPGCGVVGTTACSAPSGAPYCKDLVCCATVCTVEPFCCDVAWDAMCVDLATDLCATADEPCLSGHGGIGCEDADCMSAVVAVDPSCSSVWDEGCAILARFTFGCQPTGEEPTPDLTAFQAYRTAETTENFSVLTSAVVFRPTDIPGPMPPATPLGTTFGGEGLDLAGMDELGEDLVSLGVGEENLSRGKSIRIAAIEDAAYVQGAIRHEDLRNVNVEHGQRMFYNELITAPSHGTASLGIMAAQDNGFGMTGIAPDAEPWFFPSFSLNEGARLLSAMTAAYETFGPGDVISYSIQFGTNTCIVPGECPAGTGFITLGAGVWTLVRVGSDLGITSVLASGNNGCSLDGIEEFGGDSGAIIVSASEPGAPYCRMEFSNHTTGGQAIPHVSAWGAAVATTGHTGDLFGPEDPSRQYTMSFGGTSAATPMIAGIVARLQGIAKMIYGIPLMPEQIRGTRAGWQQCLLNRGSPAFPGSEDESECFGDTQTQTDDPAGEPNFIGIVPDGLDWTANMLTTGFFDQSPLVEDVVIVRGGQPYGNRLSIKAADNNFLGLTGQFTEAGFSPPGMTSGSGLFVPQIGEIQYLGTGSVTDFVVVGDSDATGIVQTMIVQSIFKWPSVFTILIVEGFDFRTDKWSFIDIITDSSQGADLGNGDFGFTHVASSSERFVNPSSGRILVRFWTLGFPGFGSLGGDTPETSYRLRADWVNFFVSTEPGASLP